VVPEGARNSVGGMRVAAQGVEEQAGMAALVGAQGFDLVAQKRIALAGDFAGVEQQVDVVPLDDVARGVAQLGAWVERGTVGLVSHRAFLSSGAP
jgi:hypothetical protein